MRREGRGMNISMDSLLSSIEKTRIEMIDLAQQLGYSNPNVVQCSQKLDLLLNVYGNTQIKH
jgi:Spo0E like sporulation regulatory protein